ncbi:MAG: hypothetical protein IJ581_04430 [Paludibacteraceae bacterium]|nr:hypothetical protein [Paludibacteraceae bacterium]
MTRVERYIYDLVKGKPWLKDLLRNIYQSVFDILPRKKEFFAGDLQYKEHFFLGFHDIQPFSEDGTKVIALRADIEGYMPTENDALHVGYFDFYDGKIGRFHCLADSYAWNFHKGCRLQWLDTDHIIFNTREGNKAFATTINVGTGEKTRYSFPIDSISSGGQYATTLSFERLEYLMPGYGYLHSIDNSEKEQPIPSDIGLSLVNLYSGESEFLFSYKDLADKCDNSTHLYHYITHTAFSKDDRYVSCLHRYIALEDKDKRTTQLIIYDRQTKQYFALPTQGMVSHYVWNSKNQIIAYCKVRDKECHVLFTIKDGQCVQCLPIAQSALNSDGHQSFINDTSFITDTYPDKYRMAKLYKVDIVTQKTELIASVYSPKQFQTQNMYNHIACDLHPRVSRDGKYVCFDSPRTGIRSLHIMSLSK